MSEQLHCVFLDARGVPTREAYIYEIPQPPFDTPGFAWVTAAVLDAVLSYSEDGLPQKTSSND
jgi:hypothetical protein